MWQIAQRDYKFGKGSKHASLTRATYDAVGNRFRSLWGKEAGWAHSVLFTADLRQFADRFVTKVEVAGSTGVKREEQNGEIEVVAEEKENIMVPAKREVRVKREFSEDTASKPLALHEHEDMMSSVKRRRRRKAGA